MMKNTIVSLICGLLGAMVFTVAQSYLYSRPIAVVRMDDIIASHLKTYGEKELTESQRKALSEQFAQSLDRVIQQVARRNSASRCWCPPRWSRMRRITPSL